jgi:diadenosine tetraphosphate (Ap4A) HIT family hydrolase
LIIPKRHFAGYFQSTEEERIACTQLPREMRDRWLAPDSSIEGFNLGVNVGEVAGQTIGHCHVRLVPRRTNGVDDPRRSIGHIILGKEYY